MDEDETHAAVIAPAIDDSRGRQRSANVTARLCLFLLPVWILGAGELARFVSLNSVSGPLERNGLVKGRDFVAFYVAGALAREGRWHSLYDLDELEGEVARIVPAAAGQVGAPAYGPQVALFFSQFARLSYLDARWFWLAASVVLYLLSAEITMRTARLRGAHRALAWITVLCNPAFAMLLATGQTAALAVLAWALAAMALSGSRPFLFGLSLGLLGYKPPLLIGAIPVMLILRQWTALAGVALMVAAQWAVVFVATGTEPFRAYFGSISAVSRYYFVTDTLPHQKQSLIGFFRLLAGPGFAATFLTALGTAAVLGLWYAGRRHARMPLVVSMLIATTVLLSPHLYVYDLVVLTPALLLVAGVLSRASAWHRNRYLAWTAYALLFAPFSGAIALHLGVQSSTVAIALFLLAMHQRQIALEPELER
jgi:glycosyl transferase family 87